MTRYGLRARVITLTLAPTLIVGLLLSAFFTSNRYNDLESQLISTGKSIIEPIAIASEIGMDQRSRGSSSINKLRPSKEFRHRSEYCRFHIRS